VHNLVPVTCALVGIAAFVAVGDTSFDVAVGWVVEEDGNDVVRGCG